MYYLVVLLELFHMHIDTLIVPHYHYVPKSCLYKEADTAACRLRSLLYRRTYNDCQILGKVLINALPWPLGTGTFACGVEDPGR